jgi:hypothetical protein
MKTTAQTQYLVFEGCLSWGPIDLVTVGISEWAEEDGLVDLELHADPLKEPPVQKQERLYKFVLLWRTMRRTLTLCHQNNNICW